MSNGIIFDIKEFTVHDGPGIRTTVFLKGCPLHCLWCHNPEGISGLPQLMVTKNGCEHCGKCRLPCEHDDCARLGRCAHICPNGLIKIVGTKIDAAELASRLKRQNSIFEVGGGGITISGGEPLFQPEFLFDLLYDLKPLNTVIETSGYASQAVFRRAVELCSMVYIDLKHMNDEKHRELTGVDNSLILRNLRWLMGQKKDFVVRIPLIPGLNDDVENLRRAADFLAGEEHLLRVELMPYNPFTKAKYDMAGIPFTLDINGGDYQPNVPEDAFAKKHIQFKIL